MAINSNRAYLRALETFHTRNPTLVAQDIPQNIIQDIVAACLEEMSLHWQTSTPIAVSVSGTVPAGGGPVTLTGTTTARGNLEQTS